MKFFYYIFVIAMVVLFGWFWIFKDDFLVEIPVRDSVIAEKTDKNQAPITDILPAPLIEEPLPAPSVGTTPSPAVDSVNPVRNLDKTKQQDGNNAISNGVKIEVPFTSQAPYGVWDSIHEEACEEASIIMANVWAKDISSLSREYAEVEIQKLVKWQNDNFGYFESTTAKQTAEMAEKFYGLNYRLIENPTIEDLKNELREGNVVVMGMAGRELGNPHFTSPGPLYHMLLIKGFDKTGFITNDPGTKYGGDYHYSFSTLMSSARDWRGGKIGTITKLPVAIVFSK